MTGPSVDPLLEPGFLHRLDGLSIVNHRRLTGGEHGERRSVHKGSSIEFLDYRQYSPGDDLRRVDWNAYGRLGTLHVKLFEEEQMLTLHLLLDVSRSMDWGEPNKLQYGRRLAAALSYVGLRGFDRVEVTTIASAVVQHVGPLRGPASTPVVMRFLAGQLPERETNLPQALRSYALRHRQAGIAVIISDLLSPDGYEDGLRALLERRFEIAVLHLLSPQETAPDVAGDLRLVDRETGRSVEVTLNQDALDLYQRRLHAWTDGIAAFCRGHRIRYHQFATDRALDDLLFRDLRERGVLR